MRSTESSRSPRQLSKPGTMWSSLLLTLLPGVATLAVADDDFSDFVADDKTMTCSADLHSHPFNTQLRGVNLGGWLVLEPWITPSLFYQFLGKNEVESAMDLYSFCEVLGPEEGNRQLQRHWNTWLSAEHVESLAARGINSLRLPVGDWMFEPYGPYVGCTDGALDKADWLIETAGEYGGHCLCPNGRIFAVGSKANPDPMHPDPMNPDPSPIP